MTNRRTIYKLDNNNYIKVELLTLKEGDIFRVEEPTGEPAKFIGADGTEIASLSNTYLMAVRDAFEAGLDPEGNVYYGVDVEAIQPKLTRKERKHDI